MIRVHQDFQGRHYYAHFGGDPDAREKHRDSLDPATFKLAEQFADDWDQQAFDPDYDTLPLEHFEPLVRKVFSMPKSLYPRPSTGPQSLSNGKVLVAVVLDDEGIGVVGVVRS